MFDIIEKLYPRRFEEFKNKSNEMQSAADDARTKLFMDMFNQQERDKIQEKMERRLRSEVIIASFIYLILACVTGILSYKIISMGWPWYYGGLPIFLWFMSEYWTKLVGTYNFPRYLWDPLEKVTSEAYGIAIAIGVMLWLLAHPPYN